MFAAKKLFSIFIFVTALLGLRAECAEISSSSVRLKYEGKIYALDIYKRADSKGHKSAGMLLLPEYWGKDGLAEAQARRVAEQGYVVLVVDLYGDGIHTTQGKVAEKYLNDAEVGGEDPVLGLVAKAVETLKADSDVDPARIGAVGFGYGGGLLTDLARKTGATQFKALVSFYGGVKRRASAGDSSKRWPPVLYVRPEEDVYTTKKDFDEFAAEVKKSKWDVQLLRLNKGYYGFVDKGIESYGLDTGNTFMYYNPALADATWKRVFEFLGKKMK